MIQKSMSLKYEPASKPLHISETVDPQPQILHPLHPLGWLAVSSWSPSLCFSLFALANCASRAKTNQFHTLTVQYQPDVFLALDRAPLALGARRWHVLTWRWTGLGALQTTEGLVYGWAKFDRSSTSTNTMSTVETLSTF